MKIKKLDSSLFIAKELKSIEESPLVKPDYHQFIYIYSGKGTYKTLKTKTDFETGDIFLIRKGEEHCFSYTTESLVHTIKFKESTRLKLKETSTRLKELSVPPQKAKSPVNLKASISSDDIDIVNQLFDFIVHLGKDQNKNEKLILLQMISLVSIIERNLSYAPEMKVGDLKKEDIKLIIKHIQQNLKNPGMLTLKYIAEQFHMSVTKLSTFFKQETGLTIKQFVDSNRLTVISNQIKHGEASFSEIAYEFGFSDESHLNKAFKKHFGKTPSEWRKGE